MCGITGVLAPGARSLEDPVEGMTEVLEHRGPDTSGTWVDPAAGIALGHRRLSILDLSPAGDQPMVSGSGRYVLVLNGEIYNFRELRAELAAGRGNGSGFRGGSDTEVMLAAFEAWGIPGAVRRMVGMFAFAVWDRRARTLSLGRDRLGEKPLYYGWAGDAFVFGSELKALRRHPDFRARIDRQALDLYLRYLYVPAPASIYEDVRKLLPAHLLTVAADTLRSPRTEAYWSPKEVFERGMEDPFPGGESAAADELEARLTAAVRGQMIADVPLGAFLSGGIDSSLVVALMQAQSARPVRTFTIGFEDPDADEAPYARRVAEHLGTDHTERYVTAGEALEIVPRLPRMYDEPFADPSQIPQFLVARIARESVTVCLSGDGGDELFGGYPRYWDTRRFRFLASVPSGLRATAGSALAWTASGRMSQHLHRASPTLGGRIAGLATRLRSPDPATMYQHSRSYWNDPVSPVVGAAPSPRRLTEPDRWARLSRTAEMMMYQDVLSYLPDDLLAKVDRATMAVSLESRTPYLDHRVVELAARIPLDMKVRDGRGKWLLRKVLYRHVPAELVERPKRGFGPPIDPWLRGPLRPWGEALLSERRLREDGYLRPAVVRRIWKAYQDGASEFSTRIWAFLMFQAWLDETGARS